MKNKNFFRELVQRRICLRMLWYGFALVHFFFCAAVVPAKVTLPLIERIVLLPESSSIRIQLDHPVPFRAVRMDRREVMIAFKGVRLSEKAQMPAGERGALIRECTAAHLRNNVISLTLTTEKDVGEIQTAWDGSVNTLTVRLFPQNNDGPVPLKAKKEFAKKPKSLSGKPRQSANKEGADTAAWPSAESKATGKPKALEAKAATPPLAAKDFPSLPPEADPKVFSSLDAAAMLPLPPSSIAGMSGGGEDLLLTMNGVSCPGRTFFQEALRQCTQNNWKEAFQLLNQSVPMDFQSSCAEHEFYLRAYAYNKSNRQGDDGLYLKALTYFQEAVSYFPDSIYMPYALASMGKIYKALKNYPEAKGYFKIILENHKDFPGLPEVMFYLGQIYGLEKNAGMSIPLFQTLLAHFPDNRFAVEAKLELGKALYQQNRYGEALEILSDVLAKEPRKAIDLQDLLLVIGNSYYQLGKLQDSREALIRAFNLFPDADANPVTLTRIGDILRDTGQPEKANKVYQMVMDRYPGTDGSVISAMRRAALMEERTESELLYRKVIGEYPTHPMAHLAVVKLADQQYRAGEYRGSIETLRPLYAENPKNLRAELSYLMQAAFKGLVSEMIKTDLYPETIAISEKEKQWLNRFEDPEIFRLIGIAHLKGHLHGEAVKYFAKAEKYFGADIPPEQYFEYGVALQEAREDEQAMKKFETYIQKSPQGDHAAAAYFRMGRMLIDRKDVNGALVVLKKAASLTREPAEKVDILRLTAEAHGLLGDFKTVGRLLNELADLLSAAPEKNADMLFGVYQQLGETYVRIKSNLEAVTAFEKALNHAGKVQLPAVLVQLGDAHGAAGQSGLAMKTYRQVAATDDVFWQSVANERLQRMQVESRIKTDGAE